MIVAIGHRRKNLDIYYWNSKTPNNPEVMLRFNDHEQKNENNQLIYFEDYEYRDDV